MFKEFLHYFERLYDKAGDFYDQFEEFIIANEKDEDIKVKKKIMVYHFTMLFVYFAALPLLNPFSSIKTLVFHLVLSTINFTLLRNMKHSFIVPYFVISYMIGLVAVGTKEHNSLKIIGLALVQHNHTFLIHNNKLGKLLSIIISIFIVTNAQGHLTHMLEHENYDKVIEIIKVLQVSWPRLYLFNQLCSMHIAKKFLKLVEETREAHNRLAKNNHELNSINERLKSTLFQLEKTNKELNEAIKTRELFIASVSHEFRNPLNSMLGNIELLSMDVNDSKLLKMLDTCKICGEVLLGLINNVLDVAKINAEMLELNYQPTNFYRLLGKIWSVCSIKMRQKGLKGQLFISKDFPKYVEVDSHRLNQILLNLIGNSTKFTKSGFVKVIISWHKDQDLDDLKEPSQEYSKWIEEKGSIVDLSTCTESYKLLDRQKSSLKSLKNVSLDDLTSSKLSLLESYEEVLHRSFSIKTLSHLKAANYICITEGESNIQEKLTTNPSNTFQEKGVIKIEIIDSGCGISRSSLHRLFQPFSQADPSITRRFGGTGLGLYITKQLIQKMEGQVYVYSQEDIGSDFCMLIPAQTVTDQEIKEKFAEEDDAPQSISTPCEVKALIVDDDPLNQMIMTNYMKKLSIKPEIASNGYEAIQKYKLKGPNYYSFITMDISMPIVDGLTAGKEIRKYEKESKFNKNIPIIIVTANCTETDKNNCLDPNGDIRAAYFFRKPFKFDECKSCVKTLLSRDSRYELTQPKDLRVLIVDDDPLNSMILRQYLEKFNFKCEVAMNGKEAVKRAKIEHYDVILMDCEMPEMDGYTATGQIRKFLPRIPIIGVTGNLREECLPKARAHGMNDIETKPVNFKRLMSSMRTASMSS